MRKGTLRLLPSRVKAQKRHGVMPDVLAHGNLLLVIWIWSAEHFAVRIAEAWRVVRLAHLDIARTVKHEVHAKDFKDFPRTKFADMWTHIAGARDVLRHSFTDMHNLPPHVLLVESLMVFLQVLLKLWNGDLLALTYDRLVPQIVVPVGRLCIEALIGQVHRFIKACIECLLAQREGSCAT